MHDHMEKHQSWLYLLFIGVGLTLGVEAPFVAEQLEGLLWPLLGLLLYATFTQIPYCALPVALKTRALWLH
ncbi:hypothetical protein HORIV_52120 [Vreelandella olivaria]|uniref:Uncharacterized protein n=1 Tax=Vreelandella olivaria TaxID=390919 RepID=A0ABN5X0X0_9GAMM|nr:hypothetical protein HORIV_52120 [Halomonas olivaria]